MIKVRTISNIVTAACALVLLGTCISDPDNKDMSMPFIEDGVNALPLQCDICCRGGVLPFSCTFTDDIQLGNYNIEIHNNFDHHTHSTVSGDCEMEPVKEPHNPWIFNQDYSIPAGQTIWHAGFDIPVPEDIDPGDYHFMVRLTDASGWQQIKSVSIKVR